MIYTEKVILWNLEIYTTYSVIYYDDNSVSSNDAV